MLGIRRCGAVLAVLGVLSWAPAAHAQPERAELCPADALGCHTADLDWLYREAAFDDISWDTGWVPSGSPIQLRIQVDFGGSTEVEMGGTSVTSWPPPLAVAVPGREGTGYLRMNYGLELRIQLRFDVEVAGVRYRWTGDIPVPGIPEDLRMAGEVGFDPMLLPPADGRPVELNDTTDRVAVFTYDALGGFIPVPGVGGGFAVTLQGDLTVGYQTDRVVVDEALPIEMELLSTVSGPDPGGDGFGAAKDLEIHPEGTLFYDGQVLVVPELYLSFAGTRMDFPLAEIPLPLVDVTSDAIFDDATAHVPLPDIRVMPTTVELGEVVAGGAVEKLITIANDGEAELLVVVGEPTAPFETGATLLEIPPATEGRLAVRYRPEMAGGDAAMLFLTTNDPDEPMVVVRLEGSATGAEFPVADAGPPTDAGVMDAGPATDGGCGCRVAGASPPSPGHRAGGAMALGLLVATAAWRRLRRSARARS